MANAGSGALASFLFLVVFPAVLHKGKGFRLGPRPSARASASVVAPLSRGGVFRNRGSCAPERAGRGCAALLSNSKLQL